MISISEECSTTELQPQILLSGSEAPVESKASYGVKMLPARTVPDAQFGTGGYSTPPRWAGQATLAMPKEI